MVHEKIAHRLEAESGRNAFKDYKSCIPSFLATSALRSFSRLADIAAMHVLDLLTDFCDVCKQNPDRTNCQFCNSGIIQSLGFEKQSAMCAVNTQALHK